MVVAVREWQKKMPYEAMEGLNEAGERFETSSEALQYLKDAGIKVVTPLSRIKKMCRDYTRRFNIPFKVSEREFQGMGNADGLHVYSNGRSKIFLHPILQYYTPKYIEGVALHEIDHAEVERKWDKIL